MTQNYNPPQYIVLKGKMAKGHVWSHPPIELICTGHSLISPPDMIYVTKKFGNKICHNKCTSK